MASLFPLSIPRRRSRRFPFDVLGAAALTWAGAFLALAFVLVGQFR